MNVIVDTPIWSFALRRRPGVLNVQQQRLTRELSELIKEGRAQLLGAVRQEILSGIAEPERFEQIRRDLRAFSDVALEPEDYEEAAIIANRCRAAGIAGSAIDLLICATGIRRGWPIFTTDKDFRRYADHAPIQLHMPPIGVGEQ